VPRLWIGRFVIREKHGLYDTEFAGYVTGQVLVKPIGSMGIGAQYKAEAPDEWAQSLAPVVLPNSNNSPPRVIPSFS
jgi:hypothetical protein